MKPYLFFIFFFINTIQTACAMQQPTTGEHPIKRVSTQGLETLRQVREYEEAQLKKNQSTMSLPTINEVSSPEQSFQISSIPAHNQSTQHKRTGMYSTEMNDFQAPYQTIDLGNLVAQNPSIATLIQNVNQLNRDNQSIYPTIRRESFSWIRWFLLIGGSTGITLLLKKLGWT